MFWYKRSILVSLVVILALTTGAFSLPSPAKAQGDTTSAAQFHDAMRKLWEDHITWTRLYIVSFSADLPDTDAVAERLLQNQTDIGNAIRPYYGDDAADQLTQLLNDHITGAVDILTAAKAGDTAATDAAVEAWRANGDEIATFLSNANPDNWALEDMQAQMKMHLDLTLAEAQAHLSGDYAQSIALYDQVHDHILGMADVLSDGIVAQFPEQFGLAAAASDETTTTPTTPPLMVVDQPISTDGTVTVSVAVDTPAWVVIHADDSGAPGAIIGFAPVEPGVPGDIAVPIQGDQVTATLYAMLHVDAGEAGTFEFPGLDEPMTDANAQIIMMPFTVTVSGS